MKTISLILLLWMLHTGIVNAQFYINAGAGYSIPDNYNKNNMQHDTVFYSHHYAMSQGDTTHVADENSFNAGDGIYYMADAGYGFKKHFAAGIQFYYLNNKMSHPFGEGFSKEVIYNSKDVFSSFVMEYTDKTTVQYSARKILFTPYVSGMLPMGRITPSFTAGLSIGFIRIFRESTTDIDFELSDYNQQSFYNYNQDSMFNAYFSKQSFSPMLGLALNYSLTDHVSITISGMYRPMLNLKMDKGYRTLVQNDVESNYANSLHSYDDSETVMTSFPEDRYNIRTFDVGVSFKYSFAGNHSEKKSLPHLTDSSLYVSVRAGYALGFAKSHGSNYFFEFIDEYNTTGVEKDIISQKKFSLGQGLQSSFSLGLKVHGNISAELGFWYLHSDAQKSSHVYDGTYDESIQIQLSAQTYALNPTCVIHSSSSNSFVLLAKAGLLAAMPQILLEGRMEETDYFNPGEITVEEIGVRFTESIAWGMTMTLGCEYRLSTHLIVGIDVTGISMSWGPRKGEMYNYTRDGADVLAEQSIAEKNIEFLDEITYPYDYSADMPTKQLREFYPFSSIGVGLTCRYSF